MSFKRILLASIGTFYLLVAITALANEVVSPSEIVRQAIAEMKNSGKVASLASVVDWESHYESMPPEQRALLKVSSVEEVRKHYEQLASQEGEQVIEQVKTAVRSEGEANNPATVEKIRTLEGEARRQRQELAMRLRETNYLIQETRIDGDAATVTVRKVYQEQSTTVDLQLNRKGSTWLIKNASALSPSAVHSAGSPIGGTVEPQQAFFQP